ncbi:MAG: DUF2203 family protein [Gemmataceae bacterium]
MKRRARKNRKLRAIRLWTLPQADHAVPYLRSVVTSLRDSWLDAQKERLRKDRLAKEKPDRSHLMALEDAKNDFTKARDSVQDAVRELRRIDVFPLDPIHGTVLIPFQKEDNLAWYVFDLFDEKGLAGWRYHQDPIEQRRPMTEVDKVLPQASDTAA